MKTNRDKQVVAENLIYLIIWLIVFMDPLFRMNIQGTVDWTVAVRMWRVALTFFVLFLVNNYLLVPLFLIRKKSWKYAVFVILLFVLFALEQLALMPGREMMHLHRPFVEHLPAMPGGHPPTPVFGRFSMLINKVLIAVLMLGFNIAIKFLFKSIRDDRRLRELEKQTLESELNYLKIQISPHFFMNTLNNIHALIDMDAGKAKNTVIELSKIMRYVLYGDNRSTAPLSHEIQFMENYVALMRIRYTDNVDIRLQYPPVIPDVEIPPLLFTALIENAFKHGISYQHESFVHILFAVEKNRLSCTVANSLSPAASAQQKPGVGMKNIRKRLALIYAGNYTLDVRQDDRSYTVTLVIPLDINVEI